MRVRACLEIAAQLWLSPETVKTHVKSILRKLGVRGLTPSVVWPQLLLGHPRLGEPGMP